MFQLEFCPLGQALRLLLKPQIDFILTGQILVDISRLIAKVKNHSVSHAFVKFIGVDICAESFNAGFLVSLQQWSASKSNQDSVRHQDFYCLVQLARISTMALINKRYDVAFCFEILWQVF